MQNMPTPAFDAAILGFLNDFAQRSDTLDIIIWFISGNHLIKGGVLMALLWWAWFRTDDLSTVRTRLISVLLACIAAMGIARLLALSLPFRLRPLHDSELGFRPPIGVVRSTLEGWSSFPSDHAALFFTLAIGLLFVSRKLGLIALIYTTFFIGLPRIYLGLHHPTDIIAGVLLAILVTLCFQHPVVLRTIAQPIQSLSMRNPGLFYSLLFLLSYQIADLFNNARSFIKLGDILISG